MRRLLLQAIFLTFGLIANLYIVGDVSAELVCGALLAICCAAVGEYARSSAWTIAILLMLDCGACFTPSWCAMMPVAAYNAAMLPAISQNVEQHRAGRNHAGLRSQLPNMPQYDAMQITTVIARWVWIIPVVATLVRCRNAGAHADDMGAALIAVLLALHVVLGFMVGLLCARNVTLTRQNRRLQDSKRDQIRRLRSQLAESEEDRAASVRVATLAERTRIAREIHDNVGHMLTRAIMQSEAAQVVAQVSGQEQAAQGFAQIHDTVGEAMTLVRGAVHDLKDEGTDFVAQIEASAHGLDDSSTVNVTLSNGIDAAPAAVSRCFATTIREALNNDGSQGNINGMMGESSARFRQFHDAARTATMRDASGIGLADIEERARALGGTAVCGPYHEGWRVFVSIPKTDDDAAASATTKENV